MGARMTRRIEKPAVGCHAKADHHRLSPRVMIQFDREMFDTLRARATAEHTSFAEQVRTYIEWGFEADRQAKQRWPEA